MRKSDFFAEVIFAIAFYRTKPTKFAEFDFASLGQNHENIFSKNFFPKDFFP